jgi:two-component system LytT family response regulator
VKAILVDDDRHAMRRLDRFLKDHEDVAVIDRCANGVEAVRRIRAAQPDVVFLDIEMPEMDGFETASRLLENGEGPQIVFVTAFDEYAVRAFDARAVDYLLKPVEEPRLAETLARLRDRLAADRSREEAVELESVVQAMRTARSERGAAARRREFWVRDRQRLVRVPQSEIVWVQADRDYVHLHLPRSSLMMRETMTQMVSRLDPRHFLRIHKSTIINLEQIDQVESGAAGAHVRLRDGRRLRVGRTYRPALQSYLARRAEPIETARHQVSEARYAV